MITGQTRMLGLNIPCGGKEGILSLLHLNGNVTICFGNLILSSIRENLWGQ
jgi:hypothetical protein